MKYKKWEHLIVLAGVGPPTTRDTYAEDYIPFLNTYGVLGWEFCGCGPEGEFYFKRELPDNENIKIVPSGGIRDK